MGVKKKAQSTPPIDEDGQAYIPTDDGVQFSNDEMPKEIKRIDFVKKHQGELHSNYLCNGSYHLIYKHVSRSDKRAVEIWIDIRTNTLFNVMYDGDDFQVFEMEEVHKNQ